MRAVNHWEVVPARDATYQAFPPEIDPRVRSALAGRGIERLYSHQARCYQAARAGENVVLVTPTASGKTLAYNLPVLQSFLEDQEATALYLFPTKALSQDQQNELNEVVLGSEIPVPVFTYDGDTPSSVRVSARDEGRVIITNPDMLHTGVLPNHPKWIRFFRALRFIVVDELHTYRGIFGSHLTNVLRRLKRICAFYGATPRFICCSATIGNPLQLAERLLEEPATLIDENGAPAGERHFVLYNPPLVDHVQGIRRGVVLEAQRIATRLLLQGIKTIVFARSRVRTELIATYIRQALSARYDDGIGPGDAHRKIEVAAYRGGYLPSERRAIERGLREDAIQGVVSTTALELGIDIGGLDASVLAGFPGTIASSWQQAGRAGRRNSVSLSILVASASPIDQFIIRHPEYFFARSPENGWVDPDNIFVLLDQLKCAVFELPFADDELRARLAATEQRLTGAAGAAGAAGANAGSATTASTATASGFPRDSGELFSYLEQGGVIRHAGDRWFWSDRSYPAENVSLRTSTSDNIVIVDMTAGRQQIIGEMDLPSAKTLLYDGAIYIHRGAQHIVRTLDLENQRCYVEETRSSYFTDSIVKTDIKVLHRDVTEQLPTLHLLLGDILVRRQATKYKKLRYHTHENVGYGDISLPAEEMHTRALVLLFAPATSGGDYLASRGEAERSFVIERLGVLLRNVAPVFLLCDPHDLGVATRLKDADLDCPAIYLYDNYPGGSGLSEGLHHSLGQVLAGCDELVQECGCAAGCPSCVGPPDERAALLAGSAPAAGTRAAVVAALPSIVGSGRAGGVAAAGGAGGTAAPDAVTTEATAAAAPAVPAAATGGPA